MRTGAAGGSGSGRAKAISERRCDMVWLLHIKEENGTGDWWDMQVRTEGFRGEVDGVEMKGSWALDTVKGGACRVYP